MSATHEPPDSAFECLRSLLKHCSGHHIFRTVDPLTAESKP